MTAEKFVKSKLPHAKIERQETNGSSVYYLVRDGNASMYFAEGSTKKEAWEKAKERIDKQDKSPSSKKQFLAILSPTLTKLKI